jgi:hypothetical protein
MVRATSWLALLAISSACRVVEVFPCERDDQCAAEGDPGRCEAEGFCSFADSGCPSGRRYDELAGSGLASTCVDDDVVPGCPASYVQMIAGRPQRYHVVSQPLPWADAQADCIDDAPGKTHLVVIDESAEMQGLDLLTGTDVWLGYTDRITEGTFRWVTNAQSTFDGWAQNQPDDAGGAEDCAQQKRAPAKWYDLSCTDALAYVCECDGIPPDPSTY